QQRQRGGGAHRHDVLVRGGHAHVVLPDNEPVLVRVGAVGLGEGGQAEHVVGGGQLEVVDADRCHQCATSFRSRRRCAVMSSPGLVCAASRDSSPQRTVAAIT